MSEDQDKPERLEIHLGESDSIPPTDPKAQQLKSWANIIATTAALVTAIMAIVKPQDQTVNRNTYDQLKTSIEQTNQEIKQNHDDMVALHNYLTGYFAANSSVNLPPLSSSAVSSSPQIPDAGTPKQQSLVPIIRKLPPAPTAMASPAQMPYPLPDIHPPPSAAALPNFDSVAKR